MDALQRDDVFGAYRVVRPLGKGSMGQVYLARGPGGVRVALKLLTRRKKVARQRFDREVEVGRAIDHPNVVRVLDHGEVQGVPFLAMEYVRGENLQTVLERHGRLKPRVVLRLTRCLAVGLEEFHGRGLIHRDVKPANLLVTPEGDLKIADMGIVKDPIGSKLTGTGLVVGTPWYLAPELARGKLPSALSDLYAMALVTYLSLTLRFPVRGPRETNFMVFLARLPTARPRPWHPVAVGGPLDQVFQRALDPDPAQRYPTAAALCSAFERAFRAERARGRSVERTQSLPVVEAPEGP